MDYLTLREICGLTGASRRAMQGYEKAGLVSAVGRNKRGYLLYDSEASERVKRIRLLQQIGFSIREIQELQGLPKNLARMRIKAKTEKLLERKAEIDQIILEAARLVE